MIPEYACPIILGENMLKENIIPVKKSHKAPYGKAILNSNWPDAKWDIGGLFVHDGNIFKILDHIYKSYNCVLPITSVFGCYSVQWSGGRNSCKAFPWDYTGWTPETLIQRYNRKGIGVTYTFSNTLLKKKHLSDPSSNYLLDLLGKQKYAGNAVTVACDILSDYIRKKYPDLKQKASIVKSTMEMPKKRTFEYYDSLFKKYDMIYLHPDDNFNFKLVEKIAKSGKIDKYTLLINEPCVVNCSIRKDHYDEYSKKVIDGWHGMFNFTTVDSIHDPSHPKTICEIVTKPKQRSCTLTSSEFQKIYDLGFRNFKIQGRDASWATILYNFSIWIIEPYSVGGLF